MKFIFLIIFTSYISFAQSSNNTFIVSAKANAVYRGIKNPVQICVEGVNPSVVTVTGPGVTKADGNCNYIITPGRGRELTVNITYKNKKGKTVTEERVYKILPFPQIVFTVNGEYKPGNNYQLTKQQMINLKIGTTYEPECHLFENAKVKSFRLKIPGYKTVICNGGSFNAEALRLINKLAFNGETIVIDNIKIIFAEGYNAHMRRVSPIVIKLIH